MVTTAGLKLAKGALHGAAAERNVRSVLFHLSRSTAERAFAHGGGAAKSVQALKVHGYRVGLISDKLEVSEETDAVLGAFDFVACEKSDGTSVYEDASRLLRVPLRRTLLHSDMASSPLFSTFAEELLSFDQCLDPAGRCFGAFRVLFSQIFFESELSFAMVNLKPIVPGHVLVVPKRPVARFEMLDVDEVGDLWTAVQTVGRKLERHFGASSLTFTIQDGEAAGQTVKHVHIHVIPRAAQDFENNDDIYPEIEKNERSLHVDNEDRTARSQAEMVVETDQLRQLFA